MDIKTLVQETFYKLLLEEEKPAQPKQDADPAPEATPEKKDKPPKRKKKKKKAAPGSINIAQGSLGRGRFTAFVSEAGARSEGDPDGLMKDLGVKSASGSTDVERVSSVLQRALSFHSLMRQAFTGSSSSRVKMAEDDQPTSGVKVTVAEISTRNGIKFISHTLSAAKNAGMLSLDGAIEIGLHDGEIFIKSI